jgi:hypothetical protein
MPDSTGRQLSFLPDSPDEDGDQLDLLEEAGTEILRVDSFRQPSTAGSCSWGCGLARLADCPWAYCPVSARRRWAAEDAQR